MLNVNEEQMDNNNNNTNDDDDNLKDNGIHKVISNYKDSSEDSEKASLQESYKISKETHPKKSKKSSHKSKSQSTRSSENKKYSTDKEGIKKITKNKRNEKHNNLQYNSARLEAEPLKAGEEYVDVAYPVPSNKGHFVQLLPVIFVFLLIFGVYAVYIIYHCIPLTFESQRKVYIDVNINRGIAEVVVFHYFLILYLINFILSMVVSPGYIPETKHWAINEFHTDLDDGETYLLEKKKTGERRYCKWCCKYKPDRTHHCRVCKKCILKMDHHCPWIHNCVGWRNHKYFMLSLIYCSFTCIFISFTLLESVLGAIKNNSTPFEQLLILLFGETLNSLVGLIITAFLFFHLWLMAKGMTTIEFCEKQTNYENQSFSKYYNKGFYGNFKGIFGESPFLWFFPIDNRKGDGINFLSNAEKNSVQDSAGETIPITSKI